MNPKCFLLGMLGGVALIALLLQNGQTMPGTAPTNNPGGWQAYGEIFREINEACGITLSDLAVSLPSDYADSEMHTDQQWGQCIPDLSTGAPSLRDVLVALEWLRVEYVQHTTRNRGDFLAINLQRFRRADWELAEEVSLHRGLAAMRGAFRYRSGSFSTLCKRLNSGL